MEPTKVLSTLRDSMSAGTVFGEPIVRDGVTVIPVARVGGGVGGGRTGATGDTDTDTDGGTGTGEGARAGGGTFLRAKPAGVFVIKEGKVSWQPALDLNKVIMGGQLVAVVALLVVREIVRSRRRT
jgi:uncharacterized spore protein YtfJ